MGENLTLTQMFLNLKNDVMQVAEDIEKDKTYYDFFAYQGLVTTGDEVHAHGTDWDKLEAEYDLDKQKGAPKKEGLELTFEVGLTAELGLKPITDAEAVLNGRVPYIDEMGNYIPEYNALYSGMVSNCKCYVCHLRGKPKEMWTHLDVEVAKATVNFLSNLLEHKGPDKVTTTVKRTPQELEVLKAEVKARKEMKAGKALPEGIKTLMKSMINEGRSKEEIKELVKSHLMGKVIEEQTFEEVAKDGRLNFEVIGKLPERLESKFEKSIVEWESDDLLCKGIRSHKYIRREGTPGNYKYFYRDENGKEYEGKKPEGGRNHKYGLLCL